MFREWIGERVPHPEDQLVQEAVNTRNAIIRVTQYMLRYRSWVPLSKLDEELSTQIWSGVPQSTRLAWFLLLRDEGILELDHDGIAPQNGWGSIQCRLNVADERVVDRLKIRVGL
jgi:hypothetical protein